MAYVDSFPDEIWLQIFSLLNPDELLHSVAKVSRRFNALSNDRHLWLSYLGYTDWPDCLQWDLKRIWQWNAKCRSNWLDESALITEYQFDSYCRSVAVHPTSRRFYVSESVGILHCFDSGDLDRVCNESAVSVHRIWAYQNSEANGNFNMYSFQIARDTNLWLGTDAGNVAVVDSNTGQLLKSTVCHSDYVSKLSFDQQQTQLMTASGDSTCRLWDTTSMKCVRYGLMDR